jgi:phosphoserine phosphatase RsbU/P
MVIRPFIWRPVLLALAVIFATATMLYAGLWMQARWRSGGQPSVEIGFDTDHSASEAAQFIRRVWPGGPAERAGIRAGDRIVAIDGEPITGPDSLTDAWSRHAAGDVVHLTIRRPGVPEPIGIPATFRARPEEAFSGLAGRFIRAMFPVPFVIVGFVVLFLRLENPHVWMLALLCAGFTTTAGNPQGMGAGIGALRAFGLAYQSLFLGLVGALFYVFFASFPAPSPLDRRVPVLKWVTLVLGASLGAAGARTGGVQLPPPVSALVGPGRSGQIAVAFVLGFFVLGVVSLTGHFASTADVQARRRIRVLYFGTALGVVPGLAQAWATNFLAFRSPLWLATVVPLISFLFPLSFAYAVVVHRVLDIPVLIRRSARYLLVQRGFTFLLSLASVGATLLFAFVFARVLQPVVAWSLPFVVTLGAVFGTMLLWSGMRVHAQVNRRIDRAFFRRAYDARVILEDLAEASRTATDRRQLAQLLQRHLRGALQPNLLVVYLEERDGSLRVASGEVPAELESIAAGARVLGDLQGRGGPWPISSREDQEGLSALAPLAPDCLVPILGRSGALMGLIVLGVRLSEEPYSREDLRLLASVASQAGTALENISLAEEIAERMERERRAAHEMEIAKDVQARLLPVRAPVLASARCAARCVQARAVGGDCYDFLDLGAGRVGLVLADVSGKGIHAALVMANLVAHLRSQFGITPGDPACALQRVNRLVYGSTAAQHYATLFFGVYDDAVRTLTYVNCGHNPPVLRRSDGRIERLMPTAPVIGLFDEREWTCSVGEMRFHPGDTLAIFSDGVTEAMRGDVPSPASAAPTGSSGVGGAGDEFGEERFIAELEARKTAPVEAMVREILEIVQDFCAGQPSDDLTLLILRVV